MILGSRLSLTPHNPMATSSKRKRTTSQHPSAPQDPFRNLNVGGQDKSLSLRSLASDIYKEKLVLTDAQTTLINGLYATKQLEDHIFVAADKAIAEQKMVELGLNREAREWLDNRWRVVWVRKAEGKSGVSRTLYQWYVNTP